MAVLATARRGSTGGIWAHGTAGVTITSFGTIAGEGRGAGEVAVNFSNAASVLILEGGSQLVGEAKGGGGTLDLGGGGGAGTLSGLGSQVFDFAQYTVLSGADWTLNGANTDRQRQDADRCRPARPTLLAGSGLIEVVSGGVEIVRSGGVAKGTIVRDGGTETVFGTAGGARLAAAGGRSSAPAGWRAAPR